jgi:CDP-diacylglycerol--glycerol-3-phosphate 3-phosphatidyltransferase
VPFLVVLILARDRGASYVAAVVFAVGAATDGLDGYLARRHDSRTRTGQWLDPLADKVLVAAPVITLAALGAFPVWAAVVIVAREIGISLLRVVLGLRGRAMPASPSAKLKTSVQLTAIALYILPLGPAWDGVKLGVLIAAVVLTVWTGMQYVVRAAAWLRASRPVPPATSGPHT